jgi:hypothetical protein
MRSLWISGLVLIAAGLYLILRPPHYMGDQSVFKFGRIEATMQQERKLPGWVGGTALGAGLVLLGFGLFRRT